MANTANMKTGPCEVIIDATSVGNTEGDTTFSDGVQKRERLSAQYGENVIDLIEIGQKPTVTVRIAEPTLANIQVWMPEATAVTNNLYFGSKPGGKASADAVRLTLRPTKAANGNDEDIVLFRAVVQDRAEVGINSADDRIYEVTFLGLVDESRTDGKLIGYMKVPTGS